MKNMSLSTIAAAVGWAAVTLSPALANAEPTTVVATLCGTTTCVPIPPALAIVVIVAPAVLGNVQAAGNENGVGAQVLRGALGISIKDIERHGVFGGPNSVFRCPFGGC